MYNFSPTDYYEESTEIPAYLNDSRFDHIELPWLNNCEPVKLSNEPQKQKTSQEKSAAVKPERQHSEEPIVENEEDKSKILISQGILTTRDLFFVKSIEQYCSESTLIWFIESLKRKALPDRFHRSCLAKDLYDDILYNDASNNDDHVELFNSLNANYYFELVVSD